MKTRFVSEITLFDMGYQAVFYKSDTDWFPIDSDITSVFSNFITDMKHNNGVRYRITPKIKVFTSQNIKFNMEEQSHGYTVALLKPLTVEEQIETLDCPFIF